MERNKVWKVFVLRRERDAKSEIKMSVDFETQALAISAAKALEDDIAKATAEDDMIVVESPTQRISFYKRDFRAAEVREW